MYKSVVELSVYDMHHSQWHCTVSVHRPNPLLDAAINIEWFLDRARLIHTPAWPLRLCPFITMKNVFSKGLFSKIFKRALITIFKIKTY